MFINVSVRFSSSALFFSFFNPFFVEDFIICVAGGVIHSIGDWQDIRSMGGLSISMPFTYTA
jgi:NADH:ubiquinone oxidoreductase subunit 5 (subunit L)/multisubunit Na+/H+ antiporter MnhA subunit